MIRRALLSLIRVYQLLFSSFFGRSCRFYPTCSAYAAGSIRRHGAVRGGLLALWRLMRCQPFHPGGYDPVLESPPRWMRRLCKTASDSPSDSGPSCGNDHSHCSH